jgi:hypothetical protein
VVDQAVRGHHQVVPQLRVQLLGQRDLIQRRAHVQQPVIPLHRADAERHVPHPQPRVPAQLVIGLRAAPVLDEEQPQVLLRGAEVFGRVHRAQHRVGGDLLVEPVDQPGKRLFAANGGVEGDLLGRGALTHGASQPI